MGVECDSIVRLTVTISAIQAINSTDLRGVTKQVASESGVDHSMFLIQSCTRGTEARVYINRNQAPAFWDANEVNEDIDRYSRKIGERPRIISMPRRQGLPNGIIAHWGNVVLEPLDSDSLKVLAEGKSPKKGFCLILSATLPVPHEKACLSTGLVVALGSFGSPAMIRMGAVASDSRR